MAELYDRMRPGYPPQLVDELLACARTGASRPLRALEVGAGTGKATVLLAARGVRIDALEPSAQMAAIARRNLAQSRQVSVIESEFEAWEPGEGQAPYDLIYSAQAWHWIDPAVAYPRARALLREGGLLAAFWNRPDWRSCALGEAIEAAYARHAPELSGLSPMRPRSGESEEWERWTAQIAGAEGFVAPEVRAYRWRIGYSSGEYATLLETHSDHIVLPAERRAALIGALAAAIDRAGGAFELPMSTRLCLARAA